MSLSYRIALINVWWDSNSIDTRYFKNVAEQRSYFEQLCSGKFNPLVNFIMNDNITTNIVVRDVTTRTSEEILKCNYAVLYNEETNKFRYYFITRITQDSNKQFRVSLDLDDIQTNYFENKSSIAPCKINRGHLNRWTNVPGTTKVKFNFKPNSHLLDDEPLPEVSTRLESRNNLRINFFHGGHNFDQWLFENVLGYQYVFVSRGKYKIATQISTEYEIVQTKYTNNFSDEGIVADYGIIVAPIMKTNKKIKIRAGSSDVTEVWSTESLAHFRKINNDSSMFYSSKISLKCPFDVLNNPSLNYEIDSDGNLILKNFFSTVESTPTYVNGSTRAVYQTVSESTFSFNYDHSFIVIVDKIKTEDSTQRPSTTLTTTLNYDNVQNEIEKSSIVGVPANMDLNPKLYSKKYRYLSISYFDGSKFDFDFRFLPTGTIDFKYLESITPDTARIYVTPLIRSTIPDTVYNYDVCRELVGLVANSDTSLPYATDKFAEMLANNKNFYQAFAFNTSMSALSTVISAKDKSAGIMQAGMGTATDLIGLQMNIDNMKASPDALKNASGNAIFNSLYDDLAISGSYYKALDHDLEQAFDFMNKYGFSYGHIGKVEDFDNIRHYYNYLSADIETINANLSDAEKQRLRQRLQSVRFWNVDGVDYSQENYEEALA